MSREPIDLGHDHVATFTVWSPDRELNPHYENIPDLDPHGLIVDHLDPEGEPCSGGVVFRPSEAHLEAWNWGGRGAEFWELQSIDPLTVGGSLLCARCGDHGFITGGRWIPA